MSILREIILTLAVVMTIAIANVPAEQGPQAATASIGRG